MVYANCSTVSPYFCSEVDPTGSLWYMHVVTGTDGVCVLKLTLPGHYGIMNSGCPPASTVLPWLTAWIGLSWSPDEATHSLLSLFRASLGVTSWGVSLPAILPLLIALQMRFNLSY